MVRSQVQLGLKWVTLSQASVQGGRFLTNVVLARLLVPEMFGLVAMANVVIHVLGVVRELGLGAAYIQRPVADAEERRVAANTTFYLSLATNGALFLVASSLVPAIAAYYRAPEVEPVLRVMFVTFLFDAFGTTPSLVLQKELDFGRFALAEIAASAALAVIGIGAALLGFGVWSLVAGHLGSKAVQCTAFFLLSGWRPQRTFDRRMARELFAYGKYLWAFAILSAVGAQLDRAIMGRWIGPATLGVYTLALNLSLLPTRQITNLVNRVSFPALSTLQHDPVALRRASRRALAHVAVLSLPLGLGMAATARELVLTVYGPRWSEAIPVLEILAFYGMTLSVSAVHGPVLRAIAKPQAMLYTSILHHALLVLLLFTIGRSGVLGICYAVLFPVIVSSVISFALMLHYLSFSPWALFEPLLRSALPAAVMYGGVELFQSALGASWDLPAPALLAASAGVGALVYLACTSLVNRPMLVEFVGTLHAVATARGVRS